MISKLFQGIVFVIIAAVVIYFLLPQSVFDKNEMLCKLKGNTFVIKEGGITGCVDKQKTQEIRKQQLARLPDKIVPAKIEDKVFGQKQQGTEMNCVPENRYKVDFELNSKQDFVEFLKVASSKIIDQHKNNWVKLDNYKNLEHPIFPEDLDKVKAAPVDWEKVESSIQLTRVENRLIYILKYIPLGCGPAAPWTLKMSNDGYISVYGCCGK